MSDYRVDVKLRNNRILSLIERAGYPSTMAFCRANDLIYQAVIELIWIKKPALRRDGLYREIVYRLASALQCDPEDLFTDLQARAALTPQASRLLDEREALALSDPEVLALPDDRDPDVEIDRRHLIAECLGTLSPRERAVIEARWLDGAATLDEAGTNAGGVSRGRIHQIELQAMARIRKHLRTAHRITDARCLVSS